MVSARKLTRGTPVHRTVFCVGRRLVVVEVFRRQTSAGGALRRVRGRGRHLLGRVGAEQHLQGAHATRGELHARVRQLCDAETNEVSTYV